MTHKAFPTCSTGAVFRSDDHTLVAEAFVKLLEPEFEVIGIFADGQALLAAGPELKPDVIVLDVGMPLMNGLEAGKLIKKLSHAVKIVYLTMNTVVGIAAEAFRGRPATLSWLAQGITVRLRGLIAVRSSPFDWLAQRRHLFEQSS